MSEPYVGEIRIFAFDFAPKSWAKCAGQPLAIQTNSALFALLGTTYGGDGVTTFNLPNLQGRQPMHAGQGPGLSLRSLGEAGGTPTVTLTSAQMPVHTHTVRASTATSTSSPINTVYGSATDKLYADPVATNKKAAVAGPMDASAVGSAGGGQAHENRQPALVMNPCIALFGIFPSRN